MAINITKTVKFDRNESCETGLRHPIYTIIDELKKLNHNEGIRVLVNDYDWVLVIKNTVNLMKNFCITDNGSNTELFHELIIYKCVLNP
ncbi:hypothetical protein [Caldivirga maquilingensis]|uniref:Uncharacterized protein n=1 Tax=Caldivirga maquilingensis (strain ATCC 700844 / DSM 13496 / JCM 10307 / IC-167) TaxID=397948 RepID=A8MCC7_CALMQ|nr:hypothetical protein [Caldivirga maquilingensis]ABW01433.1 hypothetical protein Cmaq_0592 [Caldivirga maquilingensis IC-167]